MAKKILIIGAGPGGYPAAFRARELGAEVTLVEKGQTGGVCLNRGCIPSKSYLDAAHRFHVVSTLGSLLKDGSDPLLKSVREALSWEKIQERRQNVITKLTSGLAAGFRAKGIKYMQGTASFVSSGEVEIKTADGAVRETFDAVIMAAGTKPVFYKPFDAVREQVLDSDRVFAMPRLPASVIVVGGGAIGLEFSCFFNALGCKVNLVELLPNLLAGEDETVSRAIKSSFEKSGITIHLGKAAEAVSIADGAKKVRLSDGTELSAEEILVCTGRAADLSDLKLENIGVSWDRKGVKADAKLRVQGHSNIYAVGDMNGLSLLAHAASAQGATAAENAMGSEKDYDNSLIPKCIYSWPEVASVGMNKNDALKAGLKPKAQRAFFAGSGRAMTQNETDGFVQIVSDETTGKILGAQIVGASATEMIHSVSTAIVAGMTVSDFKKVVFAHPTMSETIHEAIHR